MFARRTGLAQRLLGVVDLAVDFATLGEFGLEPLPADGACRERPRHQEIDPSRRLGWEAFASARRGACEPCGERIRLLDVA